MAPAPAPALALLLALLCAPPGRGAPGGGCGVPPAAQRQSWETALLGDRASAPPATDVCTDCQQIVALLTRMANESATKAGVERFLRRQCAALPVPAVAGPCQDLLQRYLGLLLRRVQGHLKPSAVCARLELCPGEPGGAPAAPPLQAPGPQAAPGEALPVPLPLCWLCRAFVGRLEASAPAAAAEAAAEGLCRALPGAAAGACRSLAREYAAAALRGLLGRLGPRLLCRLLLACRGADAPAQDEGRGRPLAPDPCALGPGYWCSSPQAARRCQALQHCQEHVWL